MDVQFASAESERKVSILPYFDIPDLGSISKHVQNDLTNSRVRIGMNRFVLNLGACIVSEIALISGHLLNLRSTYVNWYGRQVKRLS
jgi:hypothetical protein